MKVTKTSAITGITRTLELNITEEQLQAWQSGMLVQEAFPHLSSDEREFLITGITQEEWEEAYG